MRGIVGLLAGQPELIHELEPQVLEAVPTGQSRSLTPCGAVSDSIPIRGTAITPVEDWQLPRCLAFADGGFGANAL